MEYKTGNQIACSNCFFGKKFHHKIQDGTKGFWNHPNYTEWDDIRCQRFPKIVWKEKDDWCGEWKAKNPT